MKGYIQRRVKDEELRHFLITVTSGFGIILAVLLSFLWAIGII